MSTNRQIKENSYIGTKTAQKQPKNAQKPPKTARWAVFRHIGGFTNFVIHNF